ncbi:MAG TPA: noncanonical pyrimidine nucleotidase, YjjG family [Erysipelotrichaceae bacterium]|nr:noncanonical pyrimidine nucleotidase, YjjG family [Erysipelotrichaceae bacterium]
MNYEVLIFDADDTLFDFAASERIALRNTILEFQIDYDEAHHLPIYQTINDAIWKEFEEGTITQKKLKTERFRRFAEKLDVVLDEHRFATLYMKHLSEASILLPKAEELILTLSQKVRMAIITNGLTDVQEKRIRKSVIAHHFEVIAISEELGIAKPDPGIFQFIFDRMKIEDLSKVLMIGDSLYSDIQGGINAGIATCWYRSGDSRNPKGIQATHEIDDLDQILEILSKK